MLLLAEYGNNRLQQFTVGGVHVRLISEGFTRGLWGVDSNREVIVTSQPASEVDAIVVLSYESGERLCAFPLTQAAADAGVGILSGSHGLKLSRDGRSVVMAAAGFNLVFEYTISGEFLRSIGKTFVLNSPKDICFLESGDLVVANDKAHEIVVVTGDGSSIVARLSPADDANGKFRTPIGVTVSSGKLFVLDYHSCRIQVFV